ncbi:MAG: F0F1 ATP synthase subunit gamma, partial [Thermoguttaceae bacterium]|nr:F0F1 ATP synthase subunit gamma [Thermoguttaceae bacterium]
PVVETLLPLSELAADDAADGSAGAKGAEYEFLPSPESILEEVVPTAFRVKLFKCFLDAAVGEQIARRVAMKAATDNADSMISILTTTYNRARQGQITNEIIEVVSGASALQG